MKTERRIQEIREELRSLYKNDNDAPRLIAEMIQEFTNPRGPKDDRGNSMPHNLR